MSLKNKAIKGFKWSFIDTSANMGLHFIIGIILARLLSPAEFGLVGMITVLLALSQEIVDSGLTQSLIRKSGCTDLDYNTVFYTNIVIGMICCGVMFLSSGYISTFYKQNQLNLITKVLSLNIVISSFGIVEMAILKKSIDFKQQTVISLTSSILSGIVGIGLAYMGYGVWSLVWKTLVMSATRTTLLMFFSSWKPKLLYSLRLLKEHFKFGSRVLLSGFMETAYKNILYVVIGRWFSASQLGYYTRAQQFIDLPSKNLTTVIQRVSYPVLVTIKDDGDRLTKAYRHLIRSVFLVSSAVMMIMLGLSREIVLVLIGEKWISVIPYMRIMCLAGLVYPVLALNNNMMLTKNKPTESLGFQVVTKLLMVPVIVLGIFFGIRILLIGIVIHAFVSLLIIGNYSGKLINYRLVDQVKDLLPVMVATVSMLLAMTTVGHFLDAGLIIDLIVKGLVAVSSLVLLSKALKIKELSEVVRIIGKQIGVG